MGAEQDPRPKLPAKRSGFVPGKNDSLVASNRIVVVSKASSSSRSLRLPSNKTLHALVTALMRRCTQARDYLRFYWGFIISASTLYISDVQVDIYQSVRKDQCTPYRHNGLFPSQGLYSSVYLQWFSMKWVTW